VTEEDTFVLPRSFTKRVDFYIVFVDFSFVEVEYAVTQIWGISCRGLFVLVFDRRPKAFEG
jgi:hypothetical protein